MGVLDEYYHSSRVQLYLDGEQLTNVADVNCFDALCIYEAIIIGLNLIKPPELITTNQP